MAKNTKVFKVELDPKVLLYFILLIVVLVAAWEIKGVLAMFFTAFLINAGLRPLVDWFERKGVPRLASIMMIFLGSFGLMVLLFIMLAGEFVSQFVSLVDQLPDIFARTVHYIATHFPALAEVLPLQTLEQELGQFVTSAVNSDFFSDLLTGENLLAVIEQSFGIFGSATGLLLSLFTVTMLTFYMLQRKSGVFDGAVALLPDSYHNPVSRLLEKIQNGLGAWLPGQVLLMVIISVCTYFIVLIPGWFSPDYRLDDFALPIAVLAGLFEIIPSIGPALTLILAGLLALGTSGPGSVLYVAIAFTALQTLESTFVVPLVMKRIVGIDPILVILGFIAALQLGGVIGAILVVPVLAVVQIILVEMSKEYKRQEQRRLKEKADGLKLLDKFQEKFIK